MTAPTVCLACTASLGIDPETGNEVPARADLSLVCTHPSTQVDPVSGLPRPHPRCAFVNFGSCAFFSSDPMPPGQVKPQGPHPSDAIPPNLRKASNADDA